jgi:UDP-hydrolysing UDP-N-acetyl-D-glucosamine 2-epimerase
MSRHIAILTEARSSYGYLRPIARVIDGDPDLEYSLIVTNQHLLPDFGYTIEEIERDGLNITDRIYMTLDGYSPATMAKSLGVLLLSVTDTLARLRPDIVLVLGDRGDSLMAAIAAAHMNIPVAHVQAGERSGNIDGMTRHAITRFAHIHFASGPDAADRLRRMGEEEFRIFMTGAPQLDELMNGDGDGAEAVRRLGLDPGRPLLVVVQHPVTEEFGAGVAQMEETLEAICELQEQTVLIFPNTDAGSDDLRHMVERYHRPFIRIERNLPRDQYVALMRAASVLVGNSSSALIEAPAVGLPAVNVGDRQRDRARAENVIDVPHDRRAIVDAVRRAMSSEFRAALDGMESPYLSDGRVSERVVEILKTLPIDERLLKKQIAY